MKTMMAKLLVVGATSALAACSSSGSGASAGAGGAGGGGGAGGSLPITAQGRMLAVRLPANVVSTVNSITQTPQLETTATGAVATDRTAAGGVGISGSAKDDPNPNNNQGSPGIAPAALISASADGPLAGGATVIGLSDAKGNVYFENGNFGDPQVESANAAISSVSVYNLSASEQIVLSDATTIRYRDGNAGDAEANYGVGYVGNATTNMPTSGTASYKGFFESGQSIYTRPDGSVENFGFDNGADVALAADFAAGKVTGGITGGTLQAYTNLGQNVVDVAPTITGMAIDATITGADYAGTARLVDAQGAAVGTVSNGEAIGSFFGSAGRETVAAVSIEGNATLEGGASDYVLQGVIGAVKQ